MNGVLILKTNNMLNYCAVELLHCILVKCTTKMVEANLWNIDESYHKFLALDSYISVFETEFLYTVITKIKMKNKL